MGHKCKYIEEGIADSCKRLNFWFAINTWHNVTEGLGLDLFFG
jgi:hypothetical protein